MVSSVVTMVSKSSRKDLQTIYTLNPVGPINIEELLTAEFRTDVFHFLDKESFFLQGILKGSSYLSN